MKEGGREAGKRGRGRNLLVKHTERQQSIGKRLVTRGQCAHCSATGEECDGHSWPRIGSAPLALPPCALPLYRGGHCSPGSFVPLDFGGPPFSGQPGMDPLCSQATAGSPNSWPPGDQTPSHSELPPIPAEVSQMFIRPNENRCPLSCGDDDNADFCPLCRLLFPSRGLKPS